MLPWHNICAKIQNNEMNDWPESLKTLSIRVFGLRPQIHSHQINLSRMSLIFSREENRFLYIGSKMRRNYLVFSPHSICSNTNSIYHLYIFHSRAISAKYTQAILGIGITKS